MYTLWSWKLSFFVVLKLSLSLYQKLLIILILDLSEIDANVYLGPFLEVIRSEDTAGPITGVALSSVNKFLCYGLIGRYLKLPYFASLFVFGIFVNPKSIRITSGGRYIGSSGDESPVKSDCSSV